MTDTADFPIPKAHKIDSGQIKKGNDSIYHENFFPTKFDLNCITSKLAGLKVMPSKT